MKSKSDHVKAGESIMFKLRRRDRFSAQEYLRYLQEKCKPLGYNYPIPDVGFLEKRIRTIDRKAQREIYEQLGAAVEQLKKDKLAWMRKTKIRGDRSRLEVPSIYLLMDEMIDDIVKIAETHGYKTSQEVVFGSLPVGRLNAVAIKVPSGKGIVVALNQGTVPFLIEMSSAMAFFFTTTRINGNAAWALKSVTGDIDNDISIAIKEDKRGHYEFIESLFAFFGIGVKIKDSKISETRDTRAKALHTLARVLADEAIMFIVAHEYAHVFLEHMSRRAETETFFLSNMRVEKIKRNWDQELEADNFGCQVVMSHFLSHGQPIPTSYAGIDLFFSSLEAIERIIGRHSSESHPSASIRRDHLRKLIRQTLPERAEEFLGLGIVIQKMMSELLRENENLVYRVLHDLKKSK